MKTKKMDWMVVVRQIFMLASFSLIQGCTTGDCSVSWLNWPYRTPQKKIIVPSAKTYVGPLLPPIPLSHPPPIYSFVPYNASTTEKSGERVYCVQKGDTLSGIASIYGASWKKLAEYNNLSNPNRLAIGQIISIPASFQRISESIQRTPSSPARPLDQGSSYLIRQGDSLSHIAQRSGVTVKELKIANGLTSDRIIAGKSLTIPKKGQVIAPAVGKPISAKSTYSEATVILEPAPIADLNSRSIVEIAPISTASTYEHVLYPGETLEDVARQYGSSQKKIMSLNGITDPNTLKPGAKLLIPIPE